MSYSVDRSAKSRGINAVASYDLRGDDGGGAVVRTGSGPVVIVAKGPGLAGLGAVPWLPSYGKKVVAAKKGGTVDHRSPPKNPFPKGSWMYDVFQKANAKPTKAQQIRPAARPRPVRKGVPTRRPVRSGRGGNPAINLLSMPPIPYPRDYSHLTPSSIPSTITPIEPGSGAVPPVSQIQPSPSAASSGSGGGASWAPEAMPSLDELDPGPASASTETAPDAATKPEAKPTSMITKLVVAAGIGWALWQGMKGEGGGSL